MASRSKRTIGVGAAVGAFLAGGLTPIAMAVSTRSGPRVTA